MTDKPKPLTREEWDGPYLGVASEFGGRLIATIDALFDENARLRRYRERTRGFSGGKVLTLANIIAREEGVE